MSAENRLGRPGSPARPQTARPLAARLRGALRRVAVAFGVTAGLAVVSGCTAVANAGSQSVGDQGLIDDIAGRLGIAANLSYTAVYVVAGGDTATIAQALIPTQTAFQYPGGLALVEDRENIVCGPLKGAMTCTHRVGAAATTAAIAKGGLIRPETVVAMLTSAAQDADSIVSEDDTTIAGTSATCLTIGTSADSANQFHLCVTGDGLLGAFQGTSGGVAIDITLDHYDMSTADDAFQLPTGAKIVGTAP